MRSNSRSQILKVNEREREKGEIKNVNIRQTFLPKSTASTRNDNLQYSAFVRQRRLTKILFSFHRMNDAFRTQSKFCAVYNRIDYM